MSKQERDAGQSHCAGVYWRRSYGVQQMVQDACHGYHWTVHNRSTFRLVSLFSELMTMYHIDALNKMENMQMQSNISRFLQ